MPNAARSAREQRPKFTDGVAEGYYRECPLSTRCQHLSRQLEQGQKICVRASMTEEAEGLYFARRERRERAMSRQTPDWRAAAAHAEMADRYEALAVVFGAKHVVDVPMDYLGR